jgi:hypothetical protein
VTSFAAAAVFVGRRGFERDSLPFALLVELEMKGFVKKQRTSEAGEGMSCTGKAQPVTDI